MSKYESSLYTNVEEVADACTLQENDTTIDVQNRDSRL